MLRVRRYRIFLVLAILTVVGLYHFLDFSSHGTGSVISVDTLKGFGSASSQSPSQSPPQSPVKEEFPGEIFDSTTTPTSTHSSESPTDTSSRLSDASVEDEESDHNTLIAASTPPPLPVSTNSDTSHPTATEAATASPSLKASFNGVNIYDAEEEKGKGRVEIESLESSQAPIHWTQLPEHFPVPSESVIPLPTGKPKAIPRIQHEFAEEPAAAKAGREAKLDIVRKSFLHAWTGYKENAWLEDELRPVSGSSRDPFCGWAATLVDSLDTLWIMGLKDDFKEAVKAVNEIDFTTTIRSDIPMFETTIRYLGGLLAAYDVSGQQHRNLLDKAVELAEILMGAFDTPNRMPVLYYRWEPSSAARARRAGTRVVVAEIGSLSVEFTRLAQLTKEARYYDAVARITNEFEAWQDHTALPGMWPVYVDASGCNRSSEGTAPFTFPSYTKPIVKPSSTSAASPATSSKLGSISEDTELQSARQQLQHSTESLSSEPKNKRQLDGAHVRPEDRKQVTLQPLISAVTGGAVSGITDCEPQGVTSPTGNQRQEFTLGGRSDSLYEYLPKQYMLLGGLNDQYKAMYESSVEAVKKHTLFRPMTPQGADLLMTGPVSVDHQGNITLGPEGGHLTCFAGGMIAIGSKIFNRPDELQIGSKLTDGCVWAYESTKTGIMPELFDAMMCKDAKKCPWNETAYWEQLDPHHRFRQSPEQQNLARRQLDVDTAVGDIDKGNATATMDEDTEQEPSLKNSQGSADTGPVPPSAIDSPMLDVKPPPTHEEFVKGRIADERLPPGMVQIKDRRYILRPEAIESVFIMYRITGDDYWREKGWEMFKAIQAYTRAEFGNSAINDITTETPILKDEMESFWLGETLKYFYLLFSDPDVINLDAYVFNTEAHPFNRPHLDK
ncbi:MAG: hypothetical protein M1817_006763 [Caeruleum heppii]|nr:MAG: hypothetical protein M1817_006763 [Caeruleum heppii]